MSQPVPSRTELYSRFSRRSMTTMLVLVPLLGAVSLAMTVKPDGAVSQLMAAAPFLIPLAIIVTIATLQATLRGVRWEPRSAEAQAILQDEWRQTNLHRATRIAFTVTLVAQLGIGLTVSLLDAAGMMPLALPQTRVVLAMGVATITIGLTTLIALFLLFDRESHDE